MKVAQFEYKAKTGDLFLEDLIVLQQYKDVTLKINMTMLL